MQNKNQIEEEIAFVKTLKMISQAYQEISIMRMQKIRDKVLQTREFMTSLYGVFYDVRHSYDRYLEYVQNEKFSLDLNPYSLLPRNNKKLTVLLSGNEKMNGDILSKVFKSFYEYISTEEGKKTDLLIVGKIGKEMMKQRDAERPFEFFQIPDNSTNMEDLKTLLKRFISYQEINVFYGKFRNIVNQDAVNSNITGDKPFDEDSIHEEDTEKGQEQEKKRKQEEGLLDPDRRFLYEPAIEELIFYFETQVFGALFNLIISESRLSRYASRIKSMEDSLANIKDRSLELKVSERKIKKAAKNKSQNSLIAGILMWNN